MNIDKIKEKFEDSVLNNLDRGNFYKILTFLTKERCEYVEDVVNDYLDLLNFPYEDFVEKYNKLNKEYNGIFLERASEDMNLFEKFYTI